MFAKFFIDRPVFAWVIAIMILLGGALALRNLPVSQYPSVAPPALDISVVYPGAAAQVVEDTTVALIEQARQHGKTQSFQVFSKLLHGGEANCFHAYATGSLNIWFPIVDKDRLACLNSKTAQSMFVDCWIGLKHGYVR